MAKRKSRVPKDETKKAKFKRIAGTRVRTALKAMRLIGNCASPAYEYTDADISAMITALRTGVDGLEAVFESKGVVGSEFDF